MTRTFAMRVYVATYWLLVVVVLYIVGVLLLPALETSPEAAAFMPVMVAFLGLLLVAAAAVTFWRAAPGRRWIWLVALLPALLFTLMNMPYIPFALTHPADATSFTAAMPLVAGTLVLVATGVVAFREARAGDAARGGSGRRGVAAVAAAAGAVVGALLTAQLAGAAASGGAAGVAEAPTETAIMTAKDTKFGPLAADLAAGDVLGVFIVNQDAFAHSFDIDALDVHVQLPANSTTAVALKPTAAGALEYYCAVPGHRDAGMVGTIDVR